ncbi:MAG: nucleotidyltransferase domain-containing protein [Rhodospirillales bacterium]|nr:nucleotidyltransferase domain-containing protein [Rhodospirillales bacterium]
MIAAVAERTAEIERLCGRHHVLRLALFGSAATGGHHSGTSDFDFVVEFQPLPAGIYADSYFGLLEDLERLLGGPVELVVEPAIKNPYFRQSAEQTSALLYEV